MAVVREDRKSFLVVLKIGRRYRWLEGCRSGRSSHEGLEGCDDHLTVCKAAGLSVGRARWCSGEEGRVMANWFRRGRFWRWWELTVVLGMFWFE